MHGDFTRWTHRPENGYRSVLLQQGRILLDADWNEQTEITRTHDEIRTRDIVGRAGCAAVPSGPGPFEIVDATGAPPGGKAWADLTLGAGRYYVDGIVVSAEADPARPTGLGPSLATQPFAKLTEPGVGRYAAYLDVWTRQVDAEEEPSLRESALGGPDTTTRAQTVWQVRLVGIEDDVRCSDLAARDPLERTVPLLEASLQEAPDDADPCEISDNGGYRRLENQLYRVQIHQPASGDDPATFLWSRENGSVVFGLVDISPVTDEPTQAVLDLDRVGRDEALSIGSGSVLELTSPGRELAGLPGVLATAGAPVGTSVPVTWLGGAAELADLGPNPIVRRWEGGPTPVGARPPRALEDGVQVAFPEAADARTGDYWLIPARTVRLGYGLDTPAGTLDWPVDDDGDPEARPPAGPAHHTAPLGILRRRTDDTWIRESDCRTVFPALTELVSLDLLGGDGQEAMPGEALPQPVRVCVRNGGLPVAGARVGFEPSDGGLLADDGATFSGEPYTQRTDQDGVAFAYWRLAPNGPSTQTLTVHRLDDHDHRLAPDVVATGRLSVAEQVAWTAPCSGFADTRTVQDALAQLALTRGLDLLGGDGQHVSQAGAVLPRPVRVALTSPCGPVGGARVDARAGDGLVAPGVTADDPPTALPPGADHEVSTSTGDDGVAEFWWQPVFDARGSAVLDIGAEGAPTALRVTAQLAVAERRTRGLHVVAASFSDGRTAFLNDDVVAAQDLARGLQITLDERVVQDSVRGKPVVRVVLDLPWPIESDGTQWSPTPVGTRSVELAAEWNADDDRIFWRPAGQTAGWLLQQLWQVLDHFNQKEVTGRFEIDGWAIVSAKDPRLHLNGHAATVVFNGRTVLVLPTDDEIPGGVFRQWFRLRRERPQPAEVEVPDVLGTRLDEAQDRLRSVGLGSMPIFEPSVVVAEGSVERQFPAAGAQVAKETGVILTVSSGFVDG